MLTNREPEMQYRHVGVIGGKGVAPDQFSDALRGLAIGPDDRLYAVGDSDVKVFSTDGKLLHRWRAERPGFGVAVAEDGTIYVGQPGQVQLCDPKGGLLDAWRDADRLGLVTAIGFVADNVLLADTNARCIRRYDKRGEYLNDIGNDNRMRGFLVPNRHVDFAVDAKGVIHATNPGKHRVERYTPDGKLLGHFGRFDGRDPAGFGGCCNPTNIALSREGHVVVTEKAGPRVKVYDPEGKLLAVMGDNDFDPNCKNMDVAVDSRGWIYVADTVQLQIRVFACQGVNAATQPATSTPSESVKP